MDYRSEILADGPIGYWPMWESASPFADEVGSNDLAVTGTGITYQSAQLLSALHGYSANPKLTAATTYAAVTGVAAFQFAGTVAMSAEAWVKPTTVDANARYFVATRHSSNNTGWVIYLHNTQGWVHQRMGGAAISSVVPSADTLYHLVVTYDGTNSRFFVDGQLVAGPTANTTSVTATAGNPFRVGQRVNDTALANYLGWVGHVALYDKELTAAQILHHYNVGTDPFTSIGPDLPEVAIEVDFANDPTSSIRNWVDITSSVRQFAVTRGRKDALSRPEVGTLSLTLQNQDGHFDPTNTAGDHYPNVKPMRRVRVRAARASVPYNLFHGYIEDWPLSFPDHNKNALVEVRAVDALALLNLFDLSGKNYAAQLSDARGSAVLVDCGFGTAEMNLRTGQSTMVASGTIADGNMAQSMILDVSASENGLWFVDAGGTWVFQDRHFRHTQKSSASGTVGTQGGQIGYQDIRTSYGAADIANIVKVTANGGTAETTTNTSSTATYYQRTLTWPVSGTYLVSSQNEALSAAQYIKTLYSTPALRVPEVVAVPAGATANWPTVLAAELSDRLAVAHVRPDGGTITGDKHLEGLGHSVTFEREWTVTLALSDADAQASWILGNANLSELGETTTLGY